MNTQSLFTFRSLCLAAFTLCMVAIISTVLHPQVAYAASFTVNTTNDTIDDDIGDGTCADAANSCSLRAAIQEAETVPGDDTITLPANTYTLTLANSEGDEDFAYEGDLDITDTNGTITLSGADESTTIVDANGIDRVFEVVTNASLVLQNLAVTGGTLGAESGAGIENAGDLELSNVTLTENTIAGDPAHITLYYGVGIHCASGTVSISDSTISENRFSDGVNGINGGGLYTDDACTTVTVARSTFSHNEGYEGGGAYVNNSTTNTVSFTDTTFTNNTTWRSGAGIYSDGAEGDNPTVVNRATFTNNVADTSGGGIFTDGPLQVTNATFYDNTGNMMSGVGGGLYANTVDNSVIMIAFSTFTNNSATSGGGIYYDGSNGNVRVRGVILAQNNGTNPDCYNNLVSNDYNYIADITDCIITPQAHDQLGVTPPSYMNVLTPEDNGGEVTTLAFTGNEVKDVVPSVDCTDAAGDELTTDARGVSRPENSTCDIGAYEYDQTDPVITIIEGTDTIECGVDSWTDAGATVTDSSPGLTAIPDESVTTTIPAEYTITYSATDYDGNIGSDSRVVAVQDTLVPTLTLTGSNSVTVNRGEAYTDAGAIATDTCAGSLTSNIQMTSDVDTSTPGIYSVIYTVADTTGNTATPVTRTVTVKAGPNIVEVIKRNGTLIVNYSDDTSDTITPFQGSNNFRYTINTKKKKLLITNGKVLKIYQNGVLFASKKIGKKTLPAKYYRLKVESLYSGYETVVIELAQKNQGKVIVLRLTSSNTLTKLQTALVEIKNRQALKIQFAVKKKEFTTLFGEGIHTQVNRWKLKKSGALESVY